MYNYGKTNVKKHAYSVHVRAHPTTTDINDYQYPVRASETLSLDSGASSPLIDTSLSNHLIANSLAAVTKEKTGMDGNIDLGTASAASLSNANYWYKVTTTNEGSINLSSGNAPDADSVSIGSILVVEASGSNLSVVEAVDAANYILANGDIGVFRAVDDGGTNKWTEWYKSGISTNLNAGVYDTVAKSYIKLGVCEANPSIITSDGDSIELADATELEISQNIEVNATVLEVTKDNWDYLRNNMQNEQTDFIFYDEENQQYIVTEDVKMSADAEVTGNDVNKVMVKANGEFGDVTNNIEFS